MNNKKSAKRVIMLGTHFDTMGGISSVVNVYREAGLFRRAQITYIASHCDGGPLKKLAIFLSAFFQLSALLFAGKVGLVHVHMAAYGSFWRKSIFLLLAYALRVPTILHLHGADIAIFYEQKCGPMAKRYVRYMFDSASHVVVLSETWRHWVQEISRNKNVIQIYNPVLMPRTVRPWESRKHGIVLFLGFLGKRKGVFDLLAAAKVVAEQYPELMLRLGGIGEHKGDQEQVTRTVHELGLSNQVEMLGWVRGREKEQQLDEAWLYVLPSYRECLPMSILEAMAAGLPILSTPIDGIPEAVTDGREGFLVTPGDTEMLAERMLRLLVEPGLARRMGESARDKAETTFSARAIITKIERIYLKLGIETG